MTTSSLAISAISRQQVAADQDRLALAGEVHEHVADPADALGVEAVGGLVEDDRVRVAEQHAGQPEPLAHAERVGAQPLAGDRRQADRLEHLVDPRSCGRPFDAASQRRWLRPLRPGCT